MAKKKTTIFDVMYADLMRIKKKIDNIVYRHEFELLKDKVGDLERRLTATTKRK